MSFQTQTPTLAAILTASADERLAGVNVSIPARVESYDSSEQSIDAKPLIKRGYLSEGQTRATESLPIITSVPVVFPGAGDYSITFPIAKGDTVLLIFSQFSLDKWLNSGGEVDPDDDRRFHISDAIAIPGLRPFSAPVSNPGTSAMTLTASEIRLGSNDASELLALKSDLENLKTWLDTHIHPDPSSGSTGAPTTTSPSPAGTTKVKAE